MDVDSTPSPVLISSPYLVTPITLSPNCESSPRQSGAISDVAARRFPLTAALAKNALESEKDIRVTSPSSEDRIEKSTLDMFGYYNPRGELVIAIEDLPPPRIYTCSPSPPPYDALGYFHPIYPLQPPKTTQSPSQIPNFPTKVFEPRSAQQIPTNVTARSPPIRLCKTKDCNTIIPFKHYKWKYCKRCTDRISQSKAGSHPRDSSNTHPYPYTSVPLNSNNQPNRDNSCPDPCPSSTIPASFPHSRGNSNTHPSLYTCAPLNSNNQSNRDNNCSDPCMVPSSFTIPTSSVKSTSVSTIQSVSGPGPRRSALSSSPIITDTSKTSHSSNVALHGAPNANIESVTIGKKRSRCVTEPILASTSTVNPSTAMAVKEAPKPTRLNSPTLPSISRIHPSHGEPHITHDSQPQTRPSETRKRKTRPLPKPTPAANSLVSSSSAPEPARTGPASTIPFENGKCSDPWLLRITAGTEQRRCIAPCTNMVPLSSSPYTLRCLSCVKADWIARKRGVERLIQESRAKRSTAKSEMDEKDKQEIQDKKDEKEGLRAKRRDTGSSIDSLLSLSTLTSLEDGDEETGTPLTATSPTSVSELGSTPGLAPTSTSKVALKFPGEIWRRVRNLRFCSDDGCCKRLKEGYDESICVRCQAKRREKMRVFGVSCIAVWSMRGISGDLQRLRSVKDEEEEEEVTMGDVIEGARLCAFRWCSHVLPTKEEYKWSMCLGCRSYLVKKEQQSGQEGEKKKRKKKVWGGKLTSGREADGAEWRCSSLDCGMLVGGEEQERRSTSLCVQCMRRKAREAERVELVGAMMGTATSSSTNPEQEEAPTKPHSICKASYYPEFISFSALIAQFRVELHSFLRDQAQLALHRRYMSIEDCESSTAPTTKPPATENVAPTPTSLGPLFTFKGEFSTVCNIQNTLSPSHRTAILSHLVYVRSELERASLLQLRPENTDNPLVVFKEGFAVRFVCMHAIPLGWFLSDEHGDSDVNSENQSRERETGTTDIKGELDIIVFPDHSHHVLPGQTTMIKFRMGVINFS